MADKGIAVVFGLSPTGLSVARSLVAHGVTVYGVDVLRYEVAHYSRSVRHDRRISFLPPGSELLEGLLACGRECPTKPVIFNANDQYIDFVAQNHKLLEPYYILTKSMQPGANGVFLNKRTFYEACGALKVAMPQTCFPQTEDDVREAARTLRYPVIVKPACGYKLRKVLRGKKLIEVADPQDLFSWWQKLRAWDADVVLQECIEGPEQNIAVAGLYMDRNGECRSMFTAKKYRQYPPMYGSGSYMEACWMPEIADLSVNLIQKLKYHGVCGTEYKGDTRDKQWKLIEVNVRPTIWFALTRAAGVDVVWDAYCDLIGSPNPVNWGKQNDKMRWQIFVRDIVSALYFCKKGQLDFREFWRTVLDHRSKECAIFSMSDWGGNLGYVVNTVMQVWKNYIAPPKREQ